MGKNRVREFIPKVGKKRNERVQVSIDSLIWKFYQKGVVGGP